VDALPLPYTLRQWGGGHARLQRHYFCDASPLWIVGNDLASFLDHFKYRLGLKSGLHISQARSTAGQVKGDAFPETI